MLHILYKLISLKYLFCFTVFYGVASSFTLAQNLVPNGGFESFSTCPVGFSEFTGYVSNWIDPNTGSPDYMNACANPFPAGVPQNGVGYQQAHGGNAYAGCYLTGGGFYTEYIQVQLIAPLTASESYLFKMYVVLHNKSEVASDDIGAYFSVTAPASTGVGYLNGNPVPQVSNPSGNVITDTMNWQLISGTYIATGGEEYLTIGHFLPDPLVTYLTLPYGNLGTYYYFDDVSLEAQSAGSFTASDSSVCEKFCISFTDQSTNNPTSWLWLFPGGTPPTSTDQNPSQVCYQTPGSYDVTLITSNANDTDTVTLAGYVTVNATPAIPVITQNGFVLTSSPAFSYQWQYNATNITGATNQSYTVTQSGLYTVVISDSSGCQNSAMEYVGITGIHELLADQNILISPNPSDGHFHIQFIKELNVPSVSTTVKNSIGQQVFLSEDKITNQDLVKSIDVSYLPKGIYFIELKAGGLFFRKMVLIE